MTDDKHKHQPPPEIKVINPRYEGATPEMVARALMRHRPQQGEEEDDA